MKEKPKKQQPAPIWTLIRTLCAPGDNPAGMYDWLMAWIAHAAEKPGETMAYMPLFFGEDSAARQQLTAELHRLGGKHTVTLTQADCADYLALEAPTARLMVIDGVYPEDMEETQRERFFALIVGETRPNIVFMYQGGVLGLPEYVRVNPDLFAFIKTGAGAAAELADPGQPPQVAH